MPANTENERKVFLHAENGGEVAENGVEDGGKWRGVAVSEFVNAE